MARGALGCLTVLSSALQLENFLEWARVSWLEMETEKLFASQSASFLNNQDRNVMQPTHCLQLKWNVNEMNIYSHKSYFHYIEYYLLFIYVCYVEV